MRTIIAVSMVAMLMAATGCGNKGNKDTSANSKLGPEPRAMTGQTTPPTTPTWDPGPATGGNYAGPIVNDPLPPAAPAPTGGKKYTVQKGDTLWGIATRTYGDGKQYKKIVTANPSIKADGKIQAGQTLVLP